MVNSNVETSMAATAEVAPTAKSAPRGGAVRQAILEAALDQFSSVGFEGVTTRGLAEACGVNHSLITYHFGTKLELWQALMEEIFRSYRARLARRTDGLGDLEPDVALKVGIRDFVAFCAERPELHRIMTIEGRRKTERLQWLAERHLRPVYEAGRQQIIEGQKRGTVKPGDPGRLYYAVIALAGTSFAFAPEFELVTGAAPDRSRDIEETVALIERVLFVDRRPA
jgi:AcrR family transcriptional regulator